MNTTLNSSKITSINLSEIFPLTISNPNLMCFRLAPEVERQDGNRLSFRFSRKFPEIIVIWHNGEFFVLAKPGQIMPNQNQWREALAEILDELEEDIGDRSYTIQLVREPQITPLILASLATQVLNIIRPFSVESVYLDKGVEVLREVDYWAETIELPDGLKSALTLTINSRIRAKGDLADFLGNHPYRQNLEKILINLKVQEIERNNHCTITSIVGKVGDYREKLKEKVTGSISRQKLEDAPDEQPLVSVQFGKSKQQFYYPLIGLRPIITAETSEQMEIDYGNLLKATKILLPERQKHIKKCKEQADKSLSVYGFKLEQSINSYNYPMLFWNPPITIDKIPLLFGKAFKGLRSEVLNGLYNGGVYSYHKNYEKLPRVIRITTLQLCNLTVNRFLEDVKHRLRNYGFQSEIVNSKELPQSSGTEARVNLEKAIDELLIVPSDIFLIFLPASDRNSDNEENGSLYYRIYSRLLKRGIASQIIYSDTLTNVNHKQILNQIIPGILAKLGNLPFVLADPLEIADYFIGLDISRESKENLPGSLNACASVRFYDRQGKFICYLLEDGLIQGEEIPQRFLETLLPASKLSNKTVLIYRDGRFCGREVDHLVERSRAIESKFILVECRKSGNPRLYNFSQKKILSPEKGLALRLSSREAILVTTKTSDKVGLARPLRLTLHEKGYQVPIEMVLETTLKLTLLHHGALQTPRLPMPLYGADRIAYLRLNGIYPASMLNGNCQFWL